MRSQRWDSATSCLISRAAMVPTRFRSPSARVRGSAGGHNGVKSISGALGTEEWLRIRIGVGKPALEDGREIKAGGKEYLLSPFRKQELAVLDEVLDRVRNAVETVLTKGVGAAMNEFNRRPDESEKGADEANGK